MFSNPEGSGDFNLDKLETIQSKLNEFRDNRPTLLAQDKDHSFLFHLLLQEVHELGNEISKGNSTEVPKELADCVIFILNIASEFGINVFEATMNKIERNFEKYPEEFFKGSMTYEEAVRTSKDEWSTNGGDKAFYGE